MEYKVCPKCNYANDAIETHCQKCALALDWVEPSAGAEVLESAKHQPKKKEPPPKPPQQPSQRPGSTASKGFTDVLQMGMPSASQASTNRYPYANQYISGVMKWAQIVFIISIVLNAFIALVWVVGGIGGAMQQESFWIALGGFIFGGIVFILGWFIAMFNRMLQLAFANMLQCFIQIEENTRPAIEQ